MPDTLQSQRAVLPEDTERRGQLVLRTLLVLLVPILSAAITLLLVRAITQSPTPTPASSPHVSIIVMVVFFTALVVLVRLGRPTLSALLLIGVWTLITTVVTVRGGIASIGPAFWIIPICAAGLLIDGVASISLAALATVLVGSMAWLEMQGLSMVTDPQLPLVSPPFQFAAAPLVLSGIWAGLFWTVALLTSLLAGGLQRALNQSREQEEALRDLSDQLEARVAAQTAELAQRATRAEALYEVSQALTSTLDLREILALIAEQAARLLEFDSAQVLLQQAEGGFESLGSYPSSGSQEDATTASDQPSDLSEARSPAPAAGRSTALCPELTDLEPLLSELAQAREPSVVAITRSPAGSAGRSPAQPSGPAEDRSDGDMSAAALILPMHFGTSLSGVLMLTNADGRAECGSDDLVLGQGLADQAAVAIANAQLLDQAREAATLEERTRLARDIHDTLAQGLTGIVVQLGAAQRALAVAPEEAREHLSLAQHMARESLAEARRSVWNLRSPALDRGDLAGALQALTLRPLGADVSVTFEQRGEPWLLSSAVESTLLRVCQEALVNVAKHAEATEAAVLLEYTPDDLRLSIDDDGVGFDTQALEQAASPLGPWSGFGLVGMRERMNALGGTLEITAESRLPRGGEGGTHILAVVPRPVREVSNR
jgi:signal transduction histidine kinase